MSDRDIIHRRVAEWWVRKKKRKGGREEALHTPLDFLAGPVPCCIPITLA